MLASNYGVAGFSACFNSSVASAFKSFCSAGDNVQNASICFCNHIRGYGSMRHVSMGAISIMGRHVDVLAGKRGPVAQSHRQTQRIGESLHQIVSSYGC